mmetsp:Transcript_17557/g.54678  ORF Transcript_17557/g.54678 Transcript_17557/m.54678 type:complete len:302 (+) Transcript_17557:3750-4655(+)
MALRHRSPSEPSEAMRRCARASLRAVVSPSAITPSLSCSATSYASVRPFTSASASAALASAASRASIAAAKSASACAAAARMGSTFSLMSQYSVMWSTHSHRPPAAVLFWRMVSTTNHSLSRSGRMALKLLLGTPPASILPLKAASSAMNWLRSFIMTVAAFHDVSVRLALPSERRWSTAAVTSSMPAGGLPSVRSSPRSFLLSESRAAAAAWSAGWAAWRSASILAFISATAASFSAAALATPVAARLSSAARSFCSAIWGTSASHCAFFSSTSSCLACSWRSRRLTDSAVASSLCTPDW